MPPGIITGERRYKGPNFLPLTYNHKRYIAYEPRLRESQETGRVTVMAS